MSRTPLSLPLPMVLLLPAVVGDAVWMDSDDLFVISSTEDACQRKTVEPAVIMRQIFIIIQ
jgi:hypothetical protein